MANDRPWRRAVAINITESCSFIITILRRPTVFSLKPYLFKGYGSKEFIDSVNNSPKKEKPGKIRQWVNNTLGAIVLTALGVTLCGCPTPDPVPPISGGVPGSMYVDLSTYLHDNDSNTLETMITDTTDMAHYDRYDTVDVYGWDTVADEEIYIGTISAPGVSLQVKDTSKMVGNVPLRMAYMKGTEKVGEATGSMWGQNTVPDHPECNSWNSDPDYFQVSVGTPVYYTLDMNDFDGDPLSLATDYGSIPDPLNNVIITPNYSGKYWEVLIYTRGWDSGPYVIGYTAEDDHSGQSTQEIVEIHIN